MRTKSLWSLVAGVLIMVLAGLWSQSDAGVSVGIGVALPPPIVVQAPPAMDGLTIGVAFQAFTIM